MAFCNYGKHNISDKENIFTFGGEQGCKKCADKFFKENVLEEKKTMTEQEIQFNNQEIIDKEHIIRCTKPHKRTNHTYRTNNGNYQKCNSNLFFVKWNNFRKQARIICKDCLQELTSFNLDMHTIGEENGKSNPSDNNNNVVNSPINSNNMGDNNDKEINKNT